MITDKAYEMHKNVKINIDVESLRRNDCSSTKEHKHFTKFYINLSSFYTSYCSYTIFSVNYFHNIKN